MIVWDEMKNISNVKKHGIDFKDAKTILESSYIPINSNLVIDNEERWEAYGYFNRTLILIFFSLKYENNQELIRIISARRMTKSEEKEYMCKEYKDEVLGHAISSSSKGWFDTYRYKKNYDKRKL